VKDSGAAVRTVPDLSLQRFAMEKRIYQHRWLRPVKGGRVASDLADEPLLANADRYYEYGQKHAGLAASRMVETKDDQDWAEILRPHPACVALNASEDKDMKGSLLDLEEPADIEDEEDDDDDDQDES